MSLLEVEGLRLAFGALEAVKGISFSVEKGEMVALVGESGSGKSLTALSCLGLQPAVARVEGSVRFEGREMVGAPEAVLQGIRGHKISMIFQEPMTALNPLHTIEKQIGEMLAVHGVASRESRVAQREQIVGLLEQVGLGHFKDRLRAYPHQLSGGERQRVMIAMAIANAPALLIADEPTTAVDVTVQAKILVLLKELQTSLGMAILFITHDLTIVKRLADRVCVMQGGQIVEQGVVADVFAAPRHAYTQALLASAPSGEVVSPLSDRAVMEAQGVKVHFALRKGVLRKVAGFTKAVDDVTVSVPEGSCLGIVGESGSGKTTLGFALLRLVACQGRIVFLGQEIQDLRGRGLRALRQQMQMVFQDPFSSLNPRMTVRQIIAEGLRVHEPGLSEPAREARVAAILHDVGLAPEMASRYPHEFSGGQRQRISIARAMVLKPRFVVLDEPTSALDVTVQSQILDLLKDLQRKHGVSYVFISHDLRVVRAIADTLVVMHHGKVVEQGRAQAIFENPQHAYTKTLLAAAFLEGNAI